MQCTNELKLYTKDTANGKHFGQCIESAIQLYVSKSIRMVYIYSNLKKKSTISSQNRHIYKQTN